MGGELVQAKSGSWVCVQARLYQILKCRGEGSLVGPVWKALEDLVVLLEGDVADHEVVQQDAQTPHGEAARGIPSRQEPLWWGVHAGAFKVIVEPINEVSAGSEVYQADLFGPRVDQDVLVFQVAVENPSVVAQKNCLEDLGKKVPRCGFFQWTTFTDVVEEVLKGMRVLANRS